MTETRRQLRERIRAKARALIEADERRRLYTASKFKSSRRGVYSPEDCQRRMRDAFGYKERRGVVDG